MSFFTLLHQDQHTRARLGIIHTAHGDIETPAFMPVGTQASVKTLDQADLETLGAQIILGNTYHLHLRPGEDLVAEMGGLHKFMNWNKPILTDSGGFQVFSLGKNESRLTPNLSHSERGPVTAGAGPRFTAMASWWWRNITKAAKNDNNNETMEQPVRNTGGWSKGVNGRLVKIDEDGVTFNSHIDGSTHRFTPESSIEIQHKLGADVIMAFDECTPDSADYEYAKKAMYRTHRWAERSLKQYQQLNQIRKSGYQSVNLDYIFGIIQGAGHKDLREESAKFISSLDFDGIAIGGESIGYNMSATKEILDWVYPIIPQNKPHYAMGLGLSPLDIFEVVERGVDMFDCVAPTRLARHGMVYTNPPSTSLAGGENVSHPYGGGVRGGVRLNLTNSVFSRDPNPIDSSCSCLTCSPRRSPAFCEAEAGQHYTRAYIHHLFNAHEISAMRLATIHNVHFFLNLMRQIREAIKKDKFKELKEKLLFCL